MALVTTIKSFVIFVSANSKMLTQIKFDENEKKQINQMFSKFGKQTQSKLGINRVTYLCHISEYS